MNSQTHTTKATEGRAAANTLSAMVKESNESVLSLPAVRPYGLSTVALGDGVIQLGKIPTHTSYGFEKAGSGKKKRNDDDDDDRESEKDVPEIVDELIAENDFENLRNAIHELQWLIQNRRKEQAHLDKVGHSNSGEKAKHGARIALETIQLQRLQSAYGTHHRASTQQPQVRSHPVIVATPISQNRSGGGAAASAANQPNATRQQQNNRSAPAAFAGGAGGGAAASAANQPNASRQQQNNRSAPVDAKDSGNKAFLAMLEQRKRDVEKAKKKKDGDGE